VNILKPEKITEYRLQSGGYGVLDALKNIDIDKLIFTLYLPIKDEDTKHLVYFFEQQLLLAKLDKNKFLKTRHKKIKEIGRWIKENNKYQLFADFSMYIYRNYDINDNAKSPVMVAYVTTLMDTWVNLAPFGKLFYGLDNGNPLFTNEPYGAYDVPFYEVWEQIKKLPKGSPLARKLLDKTLMDELKIEYIRSNERNITNTMYTMIGLINSDNADFIYPFQNWIDHTLLIRDFPRQYKVTDFWLDLLDKRSFLLNSNGVIVECMNCGKFFKEIRFKEEFLNDGLIVLFRVTDINQGKHTIGFIDLRKRFTYSVFKNAIDTKSGQCIHDEFINFVLEIYCDLTCEYEKDDNENEAIALRRLKSLKDVGTLNEWQPAIYCYAKEQFESKGEHRQVSQKVLHHVDAFIRKANASEEAKANARHYGLILPQGYTFVRPHLRGRGKIE
jgi:hypothetical protein